MKLIAIVRGVSYGSLCVLLLLIAYAIAVAFYSGHAKSPDFISGAPYRQHVDCTHWPVHQDREWVKVLALKGGGVHGLIELGALQYLETKTGKKTYELFDLISGTSTGAIIAVALTTPDKQGEPRYSAAEMFRHYQRLGPELLTAPLYHKLLTVGGIFGPSLPSGPLDRAFRTMLGDKVRFDQQLTNVMISTFNLGAYRTEFFRSWECNPETPAYYSHEVVSAAVATPAFFPPVVIRDIQNNYQRPYVDALVSVNDPTFIAFREAVKMFPGRKYLVLTLFSGKEVTRLSEGDCPALGCGPMGAELDSHVSGRRRVSGQRDHGVHQGLCFQGQTPCGGLQCHSAGTGREPFRRVTRSNELCRECSAKSSE